MTTRTPDHEDCVTLSDPWRIRWMIRRDMPEVLAIEQGCYGAPWTQDDFLGALRQRNCIGMVAESHVGKVIGYMVYRLMPDARHMTEREFKAADKYLKLMNLAVDPRFRFMGVGRQMLETLARKLSQQQWAYAEIVVSERNYPAQCWLRECGVRATGVLQGHFSDPQGKYEPEDGYFFELYPDPGTAPLVSGG